MKIAWATDIHIDHCQPRTQQKFFNKITTASPDLVVISGDITQANYMERDFDLIANAIKQTILFILGNHDIYFSSIEETDKLIQKICKKHSNLIYLNYNETFPLHDQIGILGHSSWYDGRFGNFGCMQLSDFSVIDDFKHIWTIPALLKAKLHALGDEAANYFSSVIPRAFDTGYDKLIVVTHVPPFQEASFFRGKPSEPEALPYFTCKAVGDVLLKEMQARPEKTMEVWCGHTHDKADVQILPNLRVRAGRAVYGQPRFDILEV